MQTSPLYMTGWYSQLCTRQANVISVKHRYGGCIQDFIVLLTDLTLFTSFEADM